MAEDSKNFRITLYLSNFFNDHRSMCRIFINKKMKKISDLHNHIFNIFKLQDFHLISQSHYIPPSEDIRILQPDEILIAIPNQPCNRPICTSTPRTGDANSMTYEKKRKRLQSEEEHYDIYNSPIEASSDLHIEKAKKKKKKKKGLKNRDSKTSKNSENEQMKKDGKYLDEFKSSALDNNTPTKKEKTLKKQKILCDAHNLNEDIDKCNENKFDSNVKEKVLYFEKQTNLNESTNGAELEKPEPEDNEQNELQAVNSELRMENENQNGVCKTNTNSELQGIAKDQDEALNNKSATGNDAKQNNLNNFRQKKLFVQKRNTNAISFDLPKKSNIVKSILVSQKSLNAINPAADTPNLFELKRKIVNGNSKCSFDKEINVLPEINNTCDLQNNESIITKKSNKSKDRSVYYLSTHEELQDLKSENNCASKVIYQKNNSLEIDKENTDCLNNHNSSNTRVSEQTEPICSIDYIHRNGDDKIDENETVIADKIDEEQQIPEISGISELCPENNSTAYVDNSKELIQSDINISDNANKIDKEQQSLENNISSGISVENNNTVNLKGPIKNDTINSSGISLSIGDSFMNSIRISSDSEPAIHADISYSNESTQSNVLNNYAGEKFVTKRKRKRSHRKRKTKSSLESFNNSDFSQKPAQKAPPPTPIVCAASSANHIRFDDDGDPVGRINNLLENIVNAFTDIDSLKFQSFQCEKVNEAATAQEEKPQCDSVIAICDDDDKENNCSALISESTILKSPLMVATKPKSGDIVAFKIFRLSENYTPEISSYIIGEIQTAEDTTNLEIKIIDGLDQCTEPDGKFSIEIEGEKAIENVRIFDWARLIEARLIYP